MIAVGSGQELLNLPDMGGLVLIVSLSLLTALVISFLLVSCLVRCVTSVAILGAAALTTLSVETAVVTSLTN